MSLSTSLHDLRRRVDELRLSVAELVMTTREDGPDTADVAAADSLAELVTDLQGAVEQAHARLSEIADPYQLPAALPAVADDLDGLSLRYWRDLRSYACVAALRAAVQQRGPGWRSWQRSVELSLLRCEEPLRQAQDAVRAASAEIAEILTLYLPRGPAADAETTTSEPISSRRQP